MKKALIFTLALAIGISFGISAVLAAPKLSGPHWQFNLVGHPQGYKGGGEYSNGRAILIPLKNATGPAAIVCEGEEVLVADDTVPTFTDQEPVGAKLYFEAGDTFAILDRDATDKDGARIMIPTELEDPDNPESQRVISVDVWIRVLGKPFTCIDIDAYAFDSSQSLYFWAGSVDLNRQPGRASWTKINELFDVWYCDVVENACVTDTAVELSVFNNVFEDYFWNIQNDGTRLVQVRLYPRIQ